MRVLYFVGVLEIGGLERFVTRTALKAQETGAFEPVVCCLAERRGPFLKVLEAAHVPVYEAPKMWHRQPRHLLDLKDQIRQIAPDIVHSQVNFSLGQQLLAIRLAGCSVYCVTERSEYPRISKGAARLRRVIQFHLLRLFGAHYSANSASTARYVARQAISPLSWVDVLPNSIDPIPPNGIIRNQMRAQLNWGATDIGLGYISHLRPGKGQDIFIKAIAILREEGYPVKACLLGEGPEHPSLERLICELGLDGVVVLLGTVLNVEDYLQAFEVVSLFSVREGMPNAILEAMAAGKAVVATGVGGIPEMLAEGQAGIIIPRTVEDVTAGLRAVVQDPILRENLGQLAAMRAEKHYSLEITFSNLVKYYQGILK